MERVRNDRTDRTAIWIGLLLALGTLLIYLPARFHEFVNYDDQDYVTSNGPVTKGLTIGGVVWAFTKSHSSNWHPLTWISHMADVQFFGMNPGAHHLVNVVIHAINAVLVFVWLAGATGARWRSAMVAGLFAWHPLHVESVAWVAERKDVLSGFFWLLTLIAYTRYAARPAAWRYAITLGLFALGLMSKPMVVTLPCVLLLMDFWPLRRWTWKTAGTSPAASPAIPPNGASGAGPAPLWNLVREKIPFFVLSLLGSVVTFLVQGTAGSVIAIDQIPLPNRVANALVSYLHYLEKMFWPANLAVIYPHPVGIPAGEVIVAVVLLAAVSFFVFRYATRKGYLLTGWLWYLGTLVPVIGLVQVGSQAMADRYTYLPLIGIFIMLAWGLPEMMAAIPRREPAMAFAAVAVLAGCMTVTSIQLRVWQNSLTLFDHAQKVVPENYLARLILAKSMTLKGKTDDAMAEFTAILRLWPNFTEARYRLGACYVLKGRLDEAIECYTRALAQKPDDVDARVGYGLALMRKGLIEDSIVQFRKALELQPNVMEGHYNLGIALAKQKKAAEAIEQYSEAMRIAPDRMDVRASFADTLLELEKYPEAVEQYELYLSREPGSPTAHGALAIALSRLGRMDEAAKHFEESLRLKPAQAVPHFNLGLMQAGQHQYPEAIAHFRKSLETDATNPETHYQLGMALTATHDAASAAQSFREAIRLKPDWVVPLNALAWILSTHQDPKIRNGTEALQLARQANEKSTRASAWYLSTLSAAQAEVGEFDKAVATAQAAVELVSATTNRNAVAQFQQRLAVLKGHKPIRDPSLSPPRQ